MSRNTPLTPWLSSNSWLRLGWPGLKRDCFWRGKFIFNKKFEHFTKNFTNRSITSPQIGSIAFLWTGTIFFFHLARQTHVSTNCLTLSGRRPLSYRNQSIDLQSKSVNWFLYDNGLRHKRVKIMANGFQIAGPQILTYVW